MRLLRVSVPERVEVDQAGQVRFGDVAVGVLRSLEADAVPYAVVLIRAPGDTREVRLEVGQETSVPDHGRLRLVAMVPSTLDRRGRLTLEFTPAVGSGQTDG